ncbi:hypothetical protein KUCAC02_002195, partial [Chaenocephalus aceratus]
MQRAAVRWWQSSRQNLAGVREHQHLLSWEGRNLEGDVRDLSKNPLSTLSWQLFQHLQISEL